MAKKKITEMKTGKMDLKESEASLKELSKLSKEELLIKLGQLMSENTALRQQAAKLAETTKVFRNAADLYLKHPLGDTMKDWED
ncbi:MAG: hypothetical protein JW829_01950 [Pirellulales bacterium]|nr:hypothetical protein [Pirellulales bacterium]